jgi:hypothetical protein
MQLMSSAFSTVIESPDFFGRCQELLMLLIQFASGLNLEVDGGRCSLAEYKVLFRHFPSTSELTLPLASQRCNEIMKVPSPVNPIIISSETKTDDIFYRKTVSYLVRISRE